MSTDAQFKPGDLVTHWVTDTETNIGIITAVTEKNPAQYHVALLSGLPQVTCGEGEHEPNAVSAL